MAGGISEAFNVLYVIFGAVAGIILLVVLGLASSDAISLTLRDATQRAQMAAKVLQGGGMLISEIFDVQLLQYYSNNASKEPYNVYQIQSVISYIFGLSGFVLVVFGAEIAFFVCMMIYALFAGQALDQLLSFPFQSIFGIIVVLGAAIIINRNYAYSFTKIIQADIIKYRKKVRDINNYIYDHMPLEPAFYDSLATPQKAKAYMQTLAASNNLACLGKSMFAWSLRESLKLNSNGNMEHIDVIFTLENVVERKAGFEQQMRYGASNFVRNIASDQGTTNGTMKLVFDSSKTSNEYQVMVDGYLRDLNSKLHILKKINTIKKSLINYMIFVIMIAVFALIGVGIVYGDKVMGIVQSVRGVVNFTNPSL